MPLKDIESAIVDRELYPHVIAQGWAQTRTTIPNRKDLHVLLTLGESEKLVVKLKDLIPITKKKH